MFTSSEWEGGSEDASSDIIRQNRRNQEAKASKRIVSFIVGIVIRVCFSPVVLGVREKGGDVEHYLVPLKVGVHAVQARRVIC